MTDSRKMQAYRIAATLITIVPMMLNIYTKGSIIASFIVVPLLSLTLAGIAVAIDAKFEKILQQNKKTSQKNTTNIEALPLLEMNKGKSKKLHLAA